MAVITSNIQVASDVMRMTCTGNGVLPKPGQFYMVRAWDLDPLLSRPISVHDADEGEVTFLYRIVGKGTAILSQKKIGDEITIEGPFGNGFPEIETDLVVVGGGIGIAPLYYVCKNFKEKNPDKNLKVYLGFSNEAYCVEDFEAVADELILDVGGIITERVIAGENETLFACGPR